jgi:acyl-CoA thioesterase-1
MISKPSSRKATVLLCLLPLLLTGCRLVHAGPEVAFLGDSITFGWTYPANNFGVRGNTTAEMLARFPAAIPGRGFKEVVILGGTNDVLQHIPPETAVRNLEEIAEDTVQQQAEPILCEIPPIFHSYNLADRHDYGPDVAELNRRIAELAASHHWKLVDYYTALAGHPGYSSDGVHMKTRGYLAMEMALLRQLPAD